MNNRLYCAIIAASLAGAFHASASITVSTYPAWSGNSVFAQMGETPEWPGTEATWGETFTVPSSSPVLNSFSFSLEDSPVFEPDPLAFAGYLMEWSGTKATGTILYQSAPMTTAGLAHTEFRRFDFDINAILDPTKTYVFFISCSQYFDGTPSYAGVAGLPLDAYSGGHLVTLNNLSDFSKITSMDWNQTPQWDMAFEANFSAVPEPATTSLLAGLFAGVAAMSKMRWKRP